MYRSIEEILTAAANGELPRDAIMNVDDDVVTLVIPQDDDEPQILWSHWGDPLKILTKLLSHVGVVARRV